MLEYWWWGEGCWTFSASDVSGSSPLISGSIRVFLNKKLILETKSKEEAWNSVRKLIEASNPKCKSLLLESSSHLARSLGVKTSLPS